MNSPLSDVGNFKVVWDPPEVTEALDAAIEDLNEGTRHLPGKHNQKTHGHGGGAAVTGTYEALLSKAREGGFTYRMANGESPTKGYAFSPYPERSAVIPTRELTGDKLRAYQRKNADLLSQPGHYLGAWRDREGGEDNVWLDVSIVVKTRDAAEGVGKEFGQKAAYDLGAGKEIPLGGTGKVPAHHGRVEPGEAL